MLHSEELFDESNNSRSVEESIAVQLGRLYPIDANWEDAGNSHELGVILHSDLCKINQSTNNIILNRDMLLIITHWHGLL